MIGFDHALDSSTSDEEDKSDEEDDSGFETNTFIKHLRKCFIAIDESSYCESALFPNLRVFDRRTPE